MRKGTNRETRHGRNRKRKHKAEMINAAGILNGVAIPRAKGWLCTCTRPPFSRASKSAARECTHACECAFIARALRISEAIESDRAAVRVRDVKRMKG